LIIAAAAVVTKIWESNKIGAMLLQEREKYLADNKKK
jgi:hypothetical protein